MAVTPPVVAGRRRFPFTTMRTITQSRFGREIAATFSIRVLLLAVGMATGILTARLLGPGGRGSYAVAMAVAGVATQFGNAGLHASNTYFVARDRDLLPRLTGNSVWVSMGYGLLAGGVLVAVTALRPQLLDLSWMLVVLIVVFVPLSLAGMLLQNLLLGVGDVRSFNAVEVANRLGAVALLGVLIAVSAISVSSVFGAAVVATGAATWWTLRRVRRVAQGPLSFDRRLLRRSLRYGLRSYSAALAAFLVVRIDVVLVGSIAGFAPTGQYSIAVAMGDLLLMLPIVVGTLLFPRLCALESDRLRWHRASRTAAAMALVMIASVVVAAAVARPAVRILYGSEYLPSVRPFYFLLPGIVLLSVNIIFNNYFASLGNPLVVVIAPAVAAVLNIVLNLLWIPTHGIRGAALASTVAYGVMFVMSVAYIVWHRPWRPRPGGSIAAGYVHSGSLGERHVDD